MQKMFISLFLLVGFSTANAAVVNSQGGELYQGREYVNEHPTGKVCYLYLDQVQTSVRGKYCHDITVRAIFSTDRAMHPKDPIVLQSHVTNAHRVEYPQLKTCAMTTGNITSGMDIYGDDDTNLYVQLFSWNGKYNGADYDLFVSNSAGNKIPSRVRLHKLTWSAETNYDCLLTDKL